MTTIDTLLQHAIDRAPTRPALRWRGTSTSYAELDRAVERWTTALRVVGAGAADRVAIAPGNTPVAVAQLFATWRCGAVAVPFNERLRADDRAAAWAAAAPTLRPSDDGTFLRDEVARATRPLPHRAPHHTAHSMPAGTALILTTSGSTGTPKVVLVGHDREVETAASLVERLALTQDDVTALAVSIAHAFGLSCLLATVASAGTCVLVDSTTSTAPLADAVASSTIVHGSPTLFRGLAAHLDHGGRPPASRLRNGLCAGAAAPPHLLERLQGTGLVVLNLYGMTELGATAATRRTDDDPTRWTTAGVALPGHELRVVDGELQVRGTHVTAGYFQQPDRTAAAFTADGWFRTGDLATLDGGHLRVLGRLDDVVSIAGFTVSPAEVEQCLREHPAVTDAVVVPVPDERLGHRLVAFAATAGASPSTAPGPGPAAGLAPRDLVAHVRQRLAGYKVPYRVELMDDLPHLATGKPDRQALRARAAEA